MTDLIGKIFDRKYRLTRMIGEGGMGSVYEAEHTLIERKVAVKVMHPEFSSSKEIMDRFFREAQASSAIGHPNIIEVEDVGVEEDGTAFIVMELLNGVTLAELMEKERLSPSRAVAIILQVLSALVVAHKKGIIHRDLKPDNVFLAVDSRGRQEVKLLDFGIAKIQDDVGDQGLTKTGTVLGTPNYMSPEQARGKEVDARIDIWAAGVMLYEMLSGELPFFGESYNEVLSEILLEEAPPLAALAKGLPEGLVAVVEKAMEKDRDNRYPNVPAMIQELMPFKNGGDEAMTDSAAAALKSSMLPPPAVLTEHGKRSVVGGATLRELEFGTTGTRSPMQRSALLWPLVFLVTASALIGLAFYFKDDGQSVVESGVSIFENAIAYWTGSPEAAPATPSSETTPRNPGTEAGGAAGEVPKETGDGEPGENTAEKGAVEETAEESDAPSPEAESPSETVTIKLKGVPKKARITLNGKKVSQKVTLPRSKEKMTLRVKSSNHKPFKVEISPDSDKTIEVDLEKKGRKKSRRKR